MKRQSQSKARLSFSTYGVNSRGEVIPVKSYNFGSASEGESRAYDQVAITKVKRECSLKSIRQLSFL